jgi:shikimate kinase
MSGNLILVGFMGAGKSSVGRILARRLGRCLVETDEMIVAKEGVSIPDIFTSKGEAYFRAAEEDALGLLALKSKEVIATGGGLPCREGRPAQLRALGTVVWLSGDFDVLYRRALGAGERPMLAGRTREDAQALYQSRVPFYAQADFAVDTTARGPDQVVAEILATLRARDRTAAQRTARSLSE